MTDTDEGRRPSEINPNAALDTMSTGLGTLSVRIHSADRVMFFTEESQPFVVNRIQVKIRMLAVRLKSGEWTLRHPDPGRFSFPFEVKRARALNGRSELPATTSQDVRRNVTIACNAWLSVNDDLLTPQLPEEWQNLRDRLVTLEVEAAKIRARFAEAGVNPYQQD
jgi:hypothetical protein